MGAHEDPSFDEAFEALFPRAFRLAFRVLGSRAAAEDVAAEALARAYADWNELRESSFREAWVLRVATNLSLDLARRKRPVPEVDVAIDLQDVVALRVTLLHALRSLPRRQREAIVLRYLGGLGEQEVADVLGVTPGTVKTHLQRGMTSLRRLVVPGEGVPHANG